MPKYQELKKLYADKIKELTQDPQEWMKFLEMVGKNYRLRFDEQVLIYAQKPQATAVLPINDWNVKFHRWVNKGSKAIAVLCDLGVNEKIKYYFDVSDTHEGYNAKPVPIWQMRTGQKTAVQQMLIEAYDIEADDLTLEDTVIFSIMHFFEESRPLFENRYLKEIQLQSLENVPAGRVSDIILTSAVYVVLSRLGIDPTPYVDSNIFSGMKVFTNEKVFTIIGYEISNVASDILVRTAKKINKLNREELQHERDYIQKDGRLSASESDNRERRKGREGITEPLRRSDPEVLPGGGQGNRVSDDDERGTESVRERTSGEILHNADEVGERAGEEGGYHRGDEKERSDGLGSGDEQHRSESQGDRDGSDVFRAVEERTYFDRETEGRSDLPFLSGDDLIQQIITATPYLRVTLDEIADFFESHSRENERTAYVMKIFNDGVTEMTLTDDTKAGYKTYTNVLHLFTGDYDHRMTEGYYDWGVIAAHFEALRLLRKLRSKTVPLVDMNGQMSFLNMLDTAKTDASEFAFTDEIINTVLIKGSNMAGGKYRIIRQFANSPDQKANADFLKEEYGIGGVCPIITGTGIWAEYDTKGLRLSLHKKGEPEQELLLKWPDVAKRITYLIAIDSYLTPEEKEQYRQYKEAHDETAELLYEMIIDKNTIEDALEEAGLAHEQTGNDSEIPLETFAEPINYRYEEKVSLTFSKREKYRTNVQAIKTLLDIETENRLATEPEQEILSGYAGWGGIPDAFDANKPDWDSEYQELKSLLTDTQYKAARESTLTAFYTPQSVIDAIYAALLQMGFNGGNMLDPCCGVGAFMGRVPEAVSEKSRFYAVELDEISALIAHHLYQKEIVVHSGFEKADVPDNFFDIAVGNVPFGEFGVSDPAYDAHHFLIHDYFFAKTLDKVRPGGVVAFITSKGTLDKENSAVREYLAKRADLLGAIRLPNNTFKANAGTEVTSDIIFLQKRDRLSMERPIWVDTKVGIDGIRMNCYFLEHPEMILGQMQMVSGRYGMESTCVPFKGKELSVLLLDAVKAIPGEIEAPEYDEEEMPEESKTKAIPATPDVENFTFAEKDGQIYYRELSMMYPVNETDMNTVRIRGLMKLRDTVRTLLNLQLIDTADPSIEKQIEEKRRELNELYEQFTKRCGLISDFRNRRVFDRDSSYYLLKSLEILDDEGKLKEKADLFYKRTVQPAKAVTHVSSASDALTLSMAEKARVDLEYMMQLTGRSNEEIVRDLRGVIYLDPADQKYRTADEYLSGNIRKKLQAAKTAAAKDEQYRLNVEALKQVQPKDLTAAEISVRLGATWIHPDIYNEFMHDLLQMSGWAKSNIKIRFAAVSGEWRVEGKSSDVGNIKAYNTYGTSTTSAYRLLEDALNLRETKIFDYVDDGNGKKKPILNRRETAIVQAKQELIKQAFTDWIWKDPSRREQLCRIYNDKFNAVRPRQYDGSGLIFTGMNPEIRLREHQKNAVARILYGGNALLAHVVGAGKTFEMVAAAQESKRLGLCTKSIFVVPNHLIEQWASDYLRLYPAANILVATKRDFDTKRRKQFCAKIATGNYDAVIMGHSQFEKIPLSLERQEEYLQRQIDELTDAVYRLQWKQSEKFSVKQMEKTRKSLQAKLSKLHDTKRRDHVVTFEQLGIDRMFVDEAHYYKNLYVTTKMSNVSGISQTEAQKAMDMYMKCQYMDEITGGKGIIFATGTPISNSMTEMYTMQRYLQHGLLEENGLEMFDAWASTFGETITAIELSPDGTGYRAKTRFARFYNLPELITMFSECADIKTADVLDIPGIPEVEYHNIAIKATELQKKMVQTFADRAEKIHNGMVDPKEDNMLKITSDGRKLALDQRMLDPLLADDPGSKVNACVSNVYKIWFDTKADKSTQLIFCDLSTPKTDGTFSVYNDIRDKLVQLGIPKEEVQFMHNADTDEKKKKLFQKVRSGEVRILMGSTQKMGAGTNVQDRLIALHDLDCPWRPADLQQRQGRIERQGNMNAKVHIYRYVTENTFDSYMWQTLETKQRFISQIMTSKAPLRSCEDVDEVALSYAEIKSLSTGDPRIKEKMDLDVQVSKLKMLKSNYMSERYDLENKILNKYPGRIIALQKKIEQMTEDIAVLEAHPREEEFTGLTIRGNLIRDKKDAGIALLDVLKSKTDTQSEEIGSYRGFKFAVVYDLLTANYYMQLIGKTEHETPAGEDALGNITRLDNLLANMPDRLKLLEVELENAKQQMANAKEDLEKPFAYEAELNAKQQRLNELNVVLNMDQKKEDTIDGGSGEPKRICKDLPDENIIPHHRLKR